MDRVSATTRLLAHEFLAWKLQDKPFAEKAWRNCGVAASARFVGAGALAKPTLLPPRRNREPCDVSRQTWRRRPSSCSWP